MIYRQIQTFVISIVVRCTDLKCGAAMSFMIYTCITRIFVINQVLADNPVTTYDIELSHSDLGRILEDIFKTTRSYLYICMYIKINCHIYDEASLENGSTGGFLFM